jgi:RNA recognition motif-containing protein
MTAEGRRERMAGDGETRKVRERREEESRKSWKRWNTTKGERDAGAQTIFIGGLPEDVDKQELQDVFSTYGKVSKLDVKQPERPPYYAFLEFEEPSAAAEAIKQQHKRTFGSSSLRVEYSKGTVRSSAAVDPSERPKPSAKEPRPRDPDRVRSRERPADTSSREPNLGGGRAPRTSYRVKVRNLPQSTSWQDLKDHFKRKTDNVIYSELDKSGSEIVGTVDLDSYEDMQRAIENVNDSYFKNPFDATRLDVRPAEDVGKGAPPPEREYSRSRSKSSTPDRERERARSPGAPPPREGGRSRSRPPPPVGEPHRDSREYYDREPEYDDRSYYPKRRDREHDYRPPSRERPLPERYPRSRPRAPERGPSRERARSRSLRKERAAERSRPPPRARSPNASPQRQDGSRSPPPARREERDPPPPERGRSLQPRSDRGEPRGRANRGRSPPPRPDRGEERDRSPPRDDRSYYSYEPPPKRSRTKE